MSIALHMALHSVATILSNQAIGILIKQADDILIMQVNIPIKQADIATVDAIIILLM